MVAIIRIRSTWFLDISVSTCFRIEMIADKEHGFAILLITTLCLYCLMNVQVWVW